MDTKRRVIGFDRKIELNWLDATVDLAAQEIPVAEIRTRLAKLLDGQVAGHGPHSARGKTITVLLHIWAPDLERLISLRQDGLALIQNAVGPGRLAVHWGMCLAAYPFFGDVAAITGRLLSLQQSVALSQVTRRVAESWGTRSTVLRAAQRVVRSFVDWGVLQDTGHRGTFEARRSFTVSNEHGAATWLLEAAILGGGGSARPLASVVRHPMFFPFAITISARDLDGSLRLELHHQGADEDIVTLKKVTPKESRRTKQLQLLP